MQSNIPRAAIHVGKDKKSFSAQVGNEAERRGWDENVYRLKNADKEKNNHYNFSRKNLNFEIVKDGKIVPLGSNPIPLHERVQMRLDELGFKPYMDAKHPDQVSKNSPNCTVGMIFSGDHDVLYNLAFGNQRIDTANPDADHSHIVLQQGIYKWAKDTYDFACRKWGEENIICFAVHCDETSIHAHVQTIPVEKVKKRGRIGSKYVNKNNPDIVLSTKEWRALPKEERDNYTKQTASKDCVERVSYAKVWGETRKAKSEYLSQLHTDYHNEVGRNMVLHAVSLTMNCPRRKSEDEGIRTKSFLKPSDRRKLLLTRWRNTLFLPLLTSMSSPSLFSISRHLYKRQWLPLRKNLPFLFLHLSDKRLGERNGQQTSLMLSRLLSLPSTLNVTSRIMVYGHLSTKLTLTICSNSTN